MGIPAHSIPHVGLCGFHLGISLGELPPRLELVVLLGLSDDYIAGVMRLLGEAHSRSLRKVNDVAFEAGGALWVFATHRSGANGHFESWVQGAGAMEAKCRLAQRAIREAVGLRGD